MQPAGGFYGVESKLEPEPLLTGNVHESKQARRIPKTLRDALDRLRRGKVVRAAMGVGLEIRHPLPGPVRRAVHALSYWAGRTHRFVLVCKPR